MPEPDKRQTLRRGLSQGGVLAALCAVLGLLCLALALAWAREHERAQCWREAFETSDTPSAVDCR